MSLQLPGLHEPSVQKYRSLHPEAAYKHAVMQIAEHKESPSDGARHENGLVEPFHTQEAKDRQRYSEESAWMESATLPDVAQCDLAHGRILIFATGTLWLCRHRAPGDASCGCG
jgi:hypothetical protein